MIKPGREPLDTVLSAFCEEMLASLHRADQRRWGTAYLRGLVDVPGRKSIRRIAQLVAGHDADQSLQQFLNKSPWEWGPVRRALAGAVVRERRPMAWVVREVTFPKNGSNSVAVARQYSRSMGRLANCQLATAVFLAGDFGGCPVEWRLHIPCEWDRDTARRAKSKVPEAERWRPAWQIGLDALEEMAADRRLPRLPVVLDLTGQDTAQTVLTALELRGFTYLARVSPGRLALGAGVTGATGTAPPVRAATVAARGTCGRPRSVFTVAETPEPVDAARAVPGSRRRLLADWSWGTARPRAVWLTNYSADTAALARTAGMWDRSTQALDSLEADCGLLHFEGRSYRGWHHHVTLVGLAHGFRLLGPAPAERLSA